MSWVRRDLVVQLKEKGVTCKCFKSEVAELNECRECLMGANIYNQFKSSEDKYMVWSKG